MCIETAALRQFLKIIKLRLVENKNNNTKNIEKTHGIQYKILINKIFN